ncbi:centromere/kinetochore protein zw10 homolog [Ylistrum balloti]|uniref:centromere/kinetochore protein zw10 homolog n=1 Tax=Ylistrum balloti TaxID=509963 RepID=UPI002905A831|nr:centromere/kinetochore protein zw10 homolog [Ylistrum balloti]
MASFVTEVLTSAGKLETQEVQGKLDALTKQIDSLKMQVFEVTNNKYIDFNSTMSTSEELAENVERISKEMSDVSDRIENEIKSQLNMSTEVVESLKRQLLEVSDVMLVLERLVQIHEGLQCISGANKTCNFSKAAEAILNIHELLSSLVEGNKDVHILLALQTEYWVQKEKFLYDIGDKWKELVFWTMPNQQKCELKIMTGTENLAILKDIVVVMEKLDILDSKMKSFGERLVLHIAEPCITHSKTVVKESITGQSKTLLVKYGEETLDKPPSPVEVFSKITQIFKWLNDCFLHIVIDEEGNGQDQVLMKRLGGMIAHQVLDLIVKQCLTYAIPTSNKRMEGFQNDIAATDIFNQKLSEMNFIPPNETTLTDFVQNVNVLFANKKSQEILEKARNLMTSEMHNSVPVSDEKPLGELPALETGHDAPSSKKNRKLDLAGECKLSDNTFKLPTCHVSVCIQQLLTLAYETLHEAGESSPQCAVQLFYAVRNMLELFYCVFPTYHKESLVNFPQLSALFHNNCMFIAHHLMTMGHQFRKKLPPSINATFVDLVQKIRRLGIDTFLQQMSRQKGVMAECLGGAKGFASVAEENMYFDAERAIKQTIHQFHHLQKVWQEVLPSSVYRKAIGTLLNSVLVDITASIVVLEDISSDDARQLATLLTIIMDKAGPLLQTPSDDKVNLTFELQKNVLKWLRFKELITVLNASLLEICDRWAEGKGPLAMEFTPNEMKQLIRALFQNTERRAAVLAKIK